MLRRALTILLAAVLVTTACSIVAIYAGATVRTTQQQGVPAASATARNSDSNVLNNISIFEMCALTQPGSLNTTPDFSNVGLFYALQNQR
jgi:hypothetical protein